MQKDLYNGQVDEVRAATQKALDEGTSAQEILSDGLIAGMDVVGKDFKAGDLFIPEVLMSAKAMHAGIAILEPHFAKLGIKPVGKVVIGTVKGDLHDIGKNIVSMMFKGACFEIDDLGIDVSPEKFVDRAKAKDVDIVAMSSLLTTSMNAMKDTVKALTEAGLRDKIKIMVGGAPITQDFADAIGADGYAKDAATAVDKAKELLGK